MGTYILMTRLTPEICSDLKRREAIGKEWKHKVDQLCPDVKWHGHYGYLRGGQRRERGQSLDDHPRQRRPIVRNLARHPVARLHQHHQGPGIATPAQTKRLQGDLLSPKIQKYHFGLA